MINHAIGTEVVFIFGAGASADLGLPTMPDFCRKIADIAQSELAEEVKEDFRHVIEALSKLDNNHASEWFSADNIEHVFSTWQMEADLGKPGMQRNLQKLIKVIAWTIEMSSCWRSYDSSDQRYVPKKIGYSKLIRKLWDLYGGKLWSATKTPPFTFATLNYDLALEDTWLSELRGLHQLLEICQADWYRKKFPSVTDDIRNMIRKMIQVDPILPVANYGLQSTWHSKLQPYPLLLKLHGSINWGWCKSCGHVFNVDHSPCEIAPGPWVLESMDHPICPFHPESHWWPHEASTEYHYTPLLIPPTWSKAAHSSVLQDIWRQAHAEIVGTRRLVFIGYSLPETDIHMRYLLKSALLEREREPNIMVINWHKDEQSIQDTQNRYSSTLSIKPHQYINTKFGDAINAIVDFLQSDVD